MFVRTSFLAVMIFNCLQEGLLHLKFMLLLAVVLNFEIKEDASIYETYFERDLAYCPKCFQHQTAKCRQFLQILQSSDEVDLTQCVLNWLPYQGKRHTQILQTKFNKKKIIAKYLAKRSNLQKLSTLLTTRTLSQQYADTVSKSADGFQYCPLESVDRFVEYFRGHTNSIPPSELLIWLYMLVNVQQLLLPNLEAEDFPVPHTYATCGFTIFQAYIGKALIYYYKAPFDVKLRIAKQLLEAAMKFSYGFYGFRVYITDLNADNVVYDDAADQVYFVDLDTVLIVDSQAATEQTVTHKHTPIECAGCFAYSQLDICGHKLSDINMYAVCQLLREDLYGNHAKGFLYPIPGRIAERYPKIVALLDACVDCSSEKCKQRFAVAYKLIDLIDVVLSQNLEFN